LYLLFFADPTNPAAQTVIPCDTAAAALAAIGTHVVPGGHQLVSITATAEYPHRDLTLAELQARVVG